MLAKAVLNLPNKEGLDGSRMMARSLKKTVKKCLDDMVDPSSCVDHVSVLESDQRDLDEVIDLIKTNLCLLKN